VSSPRALPVVVLVPLLAKLAGCTTLELEDRGRFTPGGRASYEIVPGIDARRPGALLELVAGSSEGDSDEQEGTTRSAGIQPTFSIDAAIAAVEGRGSDGIAEHDEVELEVDVPGPTRVELSAENLRGHLAARGGIRVYDILSVEAIAGLGADSTRVRVEAGGLRGSRRKVRPVIVAGSRVTLRPIALFDLYGQVVTSFTPGSDMETADVQAGVELHLSRHVSAYGGYRWWKFEEDRFDFGANVELDIRGPTAGLGLRF